MVGISVVSAVNCRPPDGRPVESEIGAENEEVFNEFWASKSAMGKESVEPDRYAEHVPEVKDERQPAKRDN